MTLLTAAALRLKQTLFQPHAREKVLRSSKHSSTHLLLPDFWTLGTRKAKTKPEFWLHISSLIEKGAS
jgi:hypothetical protein